MLALMQRAHKLNHAADWLIRAKHNRKLVDDAGKLWDRVGDAEVLEEIVFDLPPRPLDAKAAGLCSSFGYYA